MANEKNRSPRHMKRPVEEDKNRIGASASICTVFACVLLLMLLAPLLLMPFASRDAATEKRELAPVPQLVVEGRLNTNVLVEAGKYFEDHFAFRSDLVELDSTLKQSLFKTSSTENVVVGNNGWLYYAGTLNDYQRKNTMSDHAVKNAAKNLALIQEHVVGADKRFVVAIAPNKNELYPQNMPYYELKGEGESNSARLMRALKEFKVNYADLHHAFGSTDEVLYFERDSHWNDRGAILAYTSIMNALGTNPRDFGTSVLASDGHMGDVDGMLHPLWAQAESQKRTKSVDQYKITNDATSVEDNYIITSSLDDKAQNSLIMYRDSFGNNLLQPFATTYKQSVFTKLVPYDMSSRMIGFANDVVIERTERHIAHFATNPPYMPAPQRSIDSVGTSGGGTTTIRTRENGPYLEIEGTVDEGVASEDDCIFVGVKDKQGNMAYYEAFCVSENKDSTADSESAQTEETAEAADSIIIGDWGFRCFVPIENVDVNSVGDSIVLAGSSAEARMLTTSFVK